MSGDLPPGFEIDEDGPPAGFEPDAALPVLEVSPAEADWEPGFDAPEAEDTASFLGRVWDTVKDSGVSALEGGSFGLSGEAKRLGASMAPDIERQGPRSIHHQTGTSSLIDSTGAEELEAENQKRLELARDRSPVASFISEAGAGAVTAMAPGAAIGKVAQGANIGRMALSQSPRAMRAIQAGGLGLLEASGRSPHKIGTAEHATDAAIGGAVSVILPEVLGGGAKLARKGYGAGRRLAGSVADVARSGRDKAMVGVSDDLVPTAKVLSRQDVPRAGGDYVPEHTATRAAARRGGDKKVIEAHSRAVQSRVTEIEDLADGVTNYETVGAKRPQIAEMVEAEDLDFDDVITEADEFMAVLREEFEQIAEDVQGLPGHATMKQLRRDVFDKYDRIADEAATSADIVAQRFMLMDDAKRQLQNKIASKTKDSKHVDDALRLMEPKIRTHLENANVWGEGAAAFQEVRNDGWREYLLLATSKDGNPSRFLTDATGRGAEDAYRFAKKGDLIALNRIVQKTGSLEGEQGAEVLLMWADRKAALLEKLTRHPGARPQDKMAAARARGAANEIRERMIKRAREAKHAGDFDEIINADIPGSGPGSTIAKKLPFGLGDMIEAGSPGSAGQRAKELMLLEGAPAGNDFAADRLGQMRRTQMLGDKVAAKVESNPILKAIRSGKGKASPGESKLEQLIQGNPASAGGASAGAVSDRLGAYSGPMVSAPQAVENDQETGGSRMAAMVKRKGADSSEAAELVRKAAEQGATQGAAEHYAQSLRDKAYRESAGYNTK